MGMNEHFVNSGQKRKPFFLSLFPLSQLTASSLPSCMICCVPHKLAIQESKQSPYRCPLISFLPLDLAPQACCPPLNLVHYHGPSPTEFARSRDTSGFCLSCSDLMGLSSAFWIHLTLFDEHQMLLVAVSCVHFQSLLQQLVKLQRVCVFIQTNDTWSPHQRVSH